MTTSVSLGELTSPDAPICYGILKPGPHVPDGVPVLKVRDYDHHGIDISKMLRTAPDIDAQYKRSRLQPGDIVMAIRGTTGVFAIVPAELSGANITQDTARIRVEPNDRDYLYQALHSRTVQAQIRLRTVGQAVKGINIASVRRLQIPWPTKERRLAIASLLSVCDKQIRLFGELLVAKKKARRGLMQALLNGTHRLRTFVDDPWTEVPLGDVFSERNETDRPDLPLLSVTNDRGVIPRTELDKRDTSNPDKTAYKRVAVGDIAYNTMRMWQGVSALSPLEGIVSPAYTVAIPGPTIHGPYAKHLFKLPHLVHLFYRHSQGLVDDTLNLKFDRFAKIRVSIPHSLEEQRKVAAVLDSCDREIELLKTIKGLLETRKRGLLSKLLADGHLDRS